MKESFETLSRHQKAVRTKDVANSLREVAFEWNCSLEEIDFDILAISTMHGEGEIVFRSNELDYMIQDNDPKPISQIYNILIFKRAASMAKDIKVALASNDDITLVYAAIKADTTISSFQYSKDSFRELINKKMLLNRLLVGTWSHSLEESIDKIFSYVNKKQEMVLQKDLKFPIAKGKDYIPDIPEAIIRHFEKSSIDEKSIQRVNHASREYIRSVHKGELLIEYYYHQKGSYGRNCRGELFGKTLQNSETLHIPMADEESIETIPHKFGINYYAKLNGYINMKEPILTIKSSLDIDKVSFRDTGNIEGGEGRNINVTIGNDPLSVQDAVGMGVTVEAEKIHIKGNTGSHSLLRGKDVIIEGTTHQKSSIYAHNADINIHRGSLVAKNVTIAFLEMGEVRAEKVKVDDLFSGSVLAKEVVIHKLHSNAKITATHLIRIDTLMGSENYIKLDNHEHKAKVEALEGKILHEDQQMNRLRRSFDEKLKHKEHQKESTIETLGMLKDYKKRKRQAPPSLLEKVQNYKNIDIELRHLKLEMKEHQMTKELLVDSMSALEKELLDSRIIIGKIEDGEGHNTIEFKLHSAKKSFKRPVQEFTAYIVKKNIQGEYEVSVQSYID